jgi:K+-sensing histidine kinase KdpD
MGQLEVGYASAMLEVLSEVVRNGDEEGERFALPAAVASGVAQTSPGMTENVAVKAPEPLPEPCVFGARRQLEQAVADLTFHALRTARPHSTVSWDVENGTGEATLVCRWQGRLGETRAEHVFSIVREALGESRGLGLLLARWAVECHGGEITAEQHDEEARFVARMPLRAEGDPGDRGDEA